MNSTDHTTWPRGFGSPETKAGPSHVRPSARMGVLAVLGGFLLAGCAVTPEPLTEAELSAAAQTNLANLTTDQEPVTQSVGLYEAMARALKYNLDHRVEMMQVALGKSQLARAGADMLPQLVANAGYAGRNTVSSSYSQTLVSGIRSAEPSFSSEKAALSGDLTFTWHILDFGLSYVRAKQSADKALIAEETKRKIVNRIIEDTRTSYWRAVSAERLLSGFRELEGRVVKAQAQTQAIRKAGQTTLGLQGGATASIETDPFGSFARIVTPSPQGVVLVDVPPGTLQMHVGKPVQVSLVMRTEDGQPTQVAVTCNFGPMGGCGRRRFNVGQADQKYLIEIMLPDVLPPATGGVIALRADIENGQVPVKLLSVRLRGTEA